MQLIYQYLLPPISVLLVGFILLRIMGKRAVNEMTSFDLLVTIVLGTAISEPIVTKNLGIASYYSLAVAIVYIIISYLSLRKPFKKILTASPTVLIRGGDIDESGLKSTHMTVEELLGELRVKGYSHTQDVEIALMEETGDISVIPKAHARPIQASDLQIKPKPAYIPIPLIIDGEIIHHNLVYLQKNKEWLEDQLVAHQDLTEITLATYERDGTVKVDTTNTKDHDSGSYNYKPGDNN